MSHVTSYYVSQAGTGLPGFHGLRYQKGAGFWGSIWSKIGLPFMKFLGKTALHGGLNVAADALEGKDIKESAMKELRSGGKQTIDFVRGMTKQEGSGRRLRRRRQTKRKAILPKITKRKVRKASVKRRKPKRKVRRTKKRKIDFAL